MPTSVTVVGGVLETGGTGTVGTGDGILLGMVGVLETGGTGTVVGGVLETGGTGTVVGGVLETVGTGTVVGGGTGDCWDWWQAGPNSPDIH